MVTWHLALESTCTHSHSEYDYVVHASAVRLRPVRSARSAVAASARAQAHHATDHHDEPRSLSACRRRCVHRRLHHDRARRRKLSHGDFHTESVRVQDQAIELPRVPGLPVSEGFTPRVPELGADTEAVMQSLAADV